MLDLCNVLTDNDRPFFGNDPTIGNLITTAQNCGIQVDVSQEQNLYNDDYYLGKGITTNVSFHGHPEQFKNLNCCVDGSAPNQITILRDELQDIQNKMNDIKEKNKSLYNILEKIKSRFEQEADEDIFYSEIWEKGLNIINEEIKSMEI